MMGLFKDYSEILQNIGTHPFLVWFIENFPIIFGFSCVLGALSGLIKQYGVDANEERADKLRGERRDDGSGD